MSILTKARSKAEISHQQPQEKTLYLEKHCKTAPPSLAPSAFSSIPRTPQRRQSCNLTTPNTPVGRSTLHYAGCPTQALTFTSPTIRTNSSHSVASRHSSPSGGNSPPPDYRIYQNGQVQKFFDDTEGDGPNKPPTTISDVCLVNDHYILVKVAPPPSYLNQTTRTEPLKRSEVQRKAQFKMCHKRNRLRKIAPIMEEPEDCASAGVPASQTSHKLRSLQCLRMQSCCNASTPPEDEIEIYRTVTKISKPTARRVEVNGQGKNLQKPAEATVKEEDITNQDIVQCQEIRNISSTITMSSVHSGVSLMNKASLVDCERPANNEKSEKSPSPRGPRRKISRFHGFHWLLRPFRSKHRKAKPKIQAVVNKTYFVKWTKPPEVLNHGYGAVRSTNKIDLDASVLRRCRSATF